MPQKQQQPFPDLKPPGACLADALGAAEAMGEALAFAICSLAGAHGAGRAQTALLMAFAAQAAGRRRAAQAILAVAAGFEQAEAAAEKGEKT